MTQLFKRRLWRILSLLKRGKNLIYFSFITFLVGYALTNNLLNKSLFVNLTEIPDYNKINVFNATNLKKIDWHDYDQIEFDKKRVGIGEQGKPGCKRLDDFQRESVYRVSLFNKKLSDKIALNRSVPDLRHPKCKTRLYLESLPTVSIVVILHNEYWSTLLRTIYSVLNRSPQHLIKEIILVDDCSTLDTDIWKNILKRDLAQYMHKIKVMQQLGRKGLIVARLTGAKAATADVLLFLDSHVEVNVNWLPPLLEPIALDYRTVMTPLIDEICYETFEYAETDPGMRGAFDWFFHHRRLPLPPKDEKKFPEPYQNPVMLGGVFAISRRFFWELGGYDSGLEIWGGEQYELSFKIWQCGGQMLEAPCSRVGHLFRKVDHPVDASGFDNYLSRNYKRVAEVWMDEYAQYLYARRPYVKVADPGDLTAQKALRQKLQCKSFKWYLTQIAYDLLQQFPLEEPLPYATGWIRPYRSPHLCIDANQAKENDLLRLQKCYFAPSFVLSPHNRQSFIFTWFTEITLKSHSFLCWDPLETNPEPGNVVGLIWCHRTGGNQIWKYEPDTKKIVHFTTLCLDHNPGEIGIFLNTCNENSSSQSWEIEVVNKEKLKKWSPALLNPITGPFEKWKDEVVNRTVLETTTYG